MGAASPATSIAIEQAWADRADELAEWTLKRMVNRTDAWGAYLPHASRKAKKQQDGTTRHETAVTAKGTLTKAILARHYAGANVGHLVGLHSTSETNTCK